MTDRPPRDPMDSGREEGGFDWDSPRWRDNDTDRPEAERARRARGGPSPRQRGAIDQGGSVSGGRRPPDAELAADAGVEVDDEGAAGA